MRVEKNSRSVTKFAPNAIKCILISLRRRGTDASDDPLFLFRVILLLFTSTCRRDKEKETATNFVSKMCGKSITRIFTSNRILNYMFGNRFRQC